MSNRPGLRIALFGAVALALFGVLFLRLWFLQVLNGSEYLAEANNNRTRELRVSAPRGVILDRNGESLVENRTSLALQIDLGKLPADQKKRRAELSHLAELTHSSLKQVLASIGEQTELAPGAPVTLRRDVGRYIVFYLAENKDLFPGVEVQSVFVRRYPHDTLAAHVLGNVGEVDEKQLKEPQYKGLEPGDETGQDGVEYSYDRYLRGRPGLTRIQIDALGQPTRGGRLVSQPPVPGDNLKLTLDAGIQVAGESAMAERGLYGGFVTMDVHSGEILGLGSFPTFEPAMFTQPTLTQKEVDATYLNPAAPLVDRAISGLYPTGSIFKIITALSALENGVVTPGETINDPGQLVVGEQTFSNAGEAANGSVSLVQALEVSSDVYFYTLGLKMWDKGYLQQWAHNLGIGRDSGIDLPNAESGLLPTQQWRDRLYREDETDRPWSAGDNVQLATGQGDLQTNPLQMAIAYAALGNGGTIVTPHVGKEIDDAAGRVLKEFSPAPQRSVRIDPTYRAAIMEGLHDAAQSPNGTSYDVFGSFPVPVCGKTGTAQRPPHADQSWYAVLAPCPNPKVVTVVTMEEGGFGVETAAPAAKAILKEYFHEHPYGDAQKAKGEPEVAG
jgi:penicillin-binding protein 2